MELQDKVAVVTGGGQGLGAAITEVLAQKGMKVAIGDVQEEKAKEQADQLREAGGICRAYRMDVSSQESVAEVVRRVVAEWGGLDVVINNAAVDVSKPVAELTVAEWDQVINVNLRGPFLVAKAGLEQMKLQRSGQIINIASTAAKRAWSNASAYHASKWGLVGFSRGLLTEAKEMGIRVSVVVAGGMKTPFILDRFPDVDPNNLQDPKVVAGVVAAVLELPIESVIPEVMVLPMRETSWP